ncbi:MAG: hypothetical protein ACFFDH_04775 [Promethearchaeota archaeon]
MSYPQDDIKSYFNEKNFKKTLEGLKRGITRGELSFDETIDLFGELLKMDNILFMEKIYPSLGYMAENLTFQQWLDIDKRMLEKFCLIQGEKILTIGHARVEEKKVTT